MRNGTKRVVAALALAAGLVGCGATGGGSGTAAGGSAAEAAPASGAPYYAEEWKDGRFTVFGSEKAHAAWKKGVHLTVSKSFIGAGPEGVTVVLEEDAKDPALRARIQKRFEERYGVDLAR